MPTYCQTHPLTNEGRMEDSCDTRRCLITTTTMANEAISGGQRDNTGTIHFQSLLESKLNGCGEGFWTLERKIEMPIKII